MMFMPECDYQEDQEPGPYSGCWVVVALIISLGGLILIGSLQ